MESEAQPEKRAEKHFEKKQLSLNWPVEFGYYERLPNHGAEKADVILVLHGYQQDGRFILRQLAPYLPQDKHILSVNGPFPVPLKSPRGWRLTYSWYFYDLGEDVYHITMEPAVKMLKELLTQLGLEERVKQVVGFSQGGYIAPFITKELSAAEQVVGLHARFRSSELTESYKFRLDNINGGQDEIVEADRTRQCHERIIAAGNRGEMIVLPKSGHEVDRATGEALGRILEQ